MTLPTDKVLALMRECDITLSLKSDFDAEIVDSRQITKFAALIQQQMIADGWRQCAKGQGTTQYCSMAEEFRRDAERWRMAKSLAVVRKSGRKLYRTDDPIPSYRLLKNADFGVIKPEINEEYEVRLFACIGETTIPELDAMMDYALDRARSANE